MRFRTLSLVGLAVLVPVAAKVGADTALLRPEELKERAAAVVTGVVSSHRHEDEEQKDGRIIRHVFMTVKVETVEKGEDKVTPGDVIQAACWTVVRLPRDVPLNDGGHRDIPGDGGRARFFLTGGPNWSVIPPNGVQLLDTTPPLHYPMQMPAAPMASDAPWHWFLIGAILLVAVAGGVLIAVRRRIEPSA